MPKKVPEQDLISIERELQAFPHGLGITELEAALAASGIAIQRRSLQRRLMLLVENGRIGATGALKGRVYRPITTERTANEDTSPIPLSALGSEVRHAVVRPIQNREPVGYERSVKRYLSQREELGEPDPFRLRYRAALLEVVGAVVRQKASDMTSFVDTWANEHLADADRQRFVALVHAELDSLHEGNFARYRIRPSEFAGWLERLAACRA